MQRGTTQTAPRRRAERVAEAAAFLAPLALILSLGLADGGFGLEARHLAGIVTWLAVILLLAAGAGSRAPLGGAAYWAFGLILALAALSLTSSLWSGSVERSFAEAGRVLVYLGLFLAAFLIAQTEKLRQRFAEGLVVSIAVLALLGLGSRLLPELLTVTDASAERVRLRFPLGYWNANGAIFGIGVALLLWLREHGSAAVLRRSAVAAIPVCLLAMYFTYSRGGLIAGAVACGVLLALSADRLRHLGMLALSVLVTVPAVLAVQERRDLADGGGDAAASQGFTVLLILLAGIAVSAAVVWLAGRLAGSGRAGALIRRAEQLARERRLLRTAGGIVVAAAILLAVLAGGRAWDRFTNPDLHFPDQPEEHFGQLSGAGRHDFWRVALDGFRESPVLGNGAGTYAFTWRQERSIELIVQDAHSVYLEALSELGVIGGLATLAVFLALLGIGLSAWSRGLRAERERSAALLAAMAAFAVAAGYDWFWEMASLGAVFFLCAGVLTSVRCTRTGRSEAAGRPSQGTRSYALALGGIATGWASIAILVGPLLMQFEIDRSQSDAAAGNTEQAVEHALTARSMQPWAASPYVQLAALAQVTGAPDVALEHYDEAAKRESDNWQIWYQASEAAAEAGEDATAERYMEKARELNPMAEEFEERDAQ